MKVKLSLILIQYSKTLPQNNENYVKVFFDENLEIPSMFASTKSEKETLKELCSKYLKVDYKWLEKQVFDFRIIKDSKYPYTFIAETVYISYVPEIIDVLKLGQFLSFPRIHENKIQLDEFYERGITGTGRYTFR